MDIKEIKELLNLLQETDYAYIKLKQEDFMIELSKADPRQIHQQPLPLPSAYDLYKSPQPVIEETQVTKTSQAPKEDPGLILVKSPIVGTFYSASGPDAEPYVKVGQRVKPKDTLCIIEAMKLMNEIEAETAGEIVEILVTNESAVEYGQVLFKIKA